jgi:hypothetical protein
MGLHYGHKLPPNWVGLLIYITVMCSLTCDFLINMHVRNGFRSSIIICPNLREFGQVIVRDHL